MSSRGRGCKPAVCCTKPRAGSCRGGCLDCGRGLLAADAAVDIEKQAARTRKVRLSVRLVADGLSLVDVVKGKAVVLYGVCSLDETITSVEPTMTAAVLNARSSDRLAALRPFDEPQGYRDVVRITL